MGEIKGKKRDPKKRDGVLTGSRFWPKVFQRGENLDATIGNGVTRTRKDLRTGEACAKCLAKPCKRRGYHGPCPAKHAMNLHIQKEDILH